MSRTKTLVRTLAPPSLHTLATTDSNAQPLRPNTLLLRMLNGGKSVKWTAAPTTANRQGEGQMKSAEKEHAEKGWVKLRTAV